MSRLLGSGYSDEGLPNCYDGWAVLKDAGASGVRLGLRLRADGQVIHEELYWTFAGGDDAKARGEACRMEYLLEAVCVFLNSGGSFVSLHNVAMRVGDLQDKFSIAWPESWTFLGLTGFDRRPPQLVFSDSQEAIVMAPGEFVERAPLLDVIRELEQNRG